MFNYCLGRKGDADEYAEEAPVKTLDEEPVKEEPEVVKDEESGEPDAEFMEVMGSGSAEKDA